jgi:hypothetical protein
MAYADAGGVHTWYAEYGSGRPLLLLHGAFTDASEFGATVPALAQHFRALIMAGDDDAIAAEHTLALYRHPRLGAGRGARHLPRAHHGKARTV